MERKSIRLIAINLAFIQLFAQQVLASKNKQKTPCLSLDTKEAEQTNIKMPRARSNEIILVDNSNVKNPIYQIIDEETGEAKPVSIYDYDNIPTHQYGANQNDFRDHFEALIRDPDIWNEMQKYFPVENFDCEEDALFFYQKYFEWIRSDGCGYAAAANYVFHMFEGKEDEFYEKFGFPMYSVINNEIDFNYELFMLKFFNYLQIEKNDDKDELEAAIQKDFYDYKADKLTEEHRKSTRLSKSDFLNWTQEDWDAYHDKVDEYEAKLKEYMDKWKTGRKKKEFYFGIYPNNQFGHLSDYLKEHGVKVKTTWKASLGKPAVDDIVGCENFNLYRVDQNGNVSKANYYPGCHYMIITEVKNRGTIYVSSWGEMYIFENPYATWTQKGVIEKGK